MGKKRDKDGNTYMRSDVFEEQNWFTMKQALVLSSEKLLRSHWKQSSRRGWMRRKA